MTLRARARGARGEPNEFRMGEKLKWALLLSINGAHNTIHVIFGPAYTTVCNRRAHHLLCPPIQGDIMSRLRKAWRPSGASVESLRAGLWFQLI